MVSINAPGYGKADLVSDLQLWLASYKYLIYQGHFSRKTIAKMRGQERNRE